MTKILGGFVARGSEKGLSAANAPNQHGSAFLLAWKDAVRQGLAQELCRKGH